jgi:hypothetical protein
MLSFTIISTVFASSMVYDYELILSYSVKNITQWNQWIFDQNPTDEESLTLFLQPQPGIESDHPEIVRRANAIVNSLPRNQRNDDYAKAKAIHLWVANNTWCDVDLARAAVGGKTFTQDDDLTPNYHSTALYVLRNKRGVCLGFTTLNVALLRAAGIPAKQAFGDMHGWYEAYIDGRWIIGDSIIDRRGDYVDGKFITWGPGTCDWFDMSIEDVASFDYFYDMRNFFMATEIIIPNDMITQVWFAMFAWNPNLEKVILPNDVVEIDEYAFIGCTSLTSVYIPASVKSIHENAFENTSDPFRPSLNVTIYGESGSYAETFAKANNIPFKVGRP